MTIEPGDVAPDFEQDTTNGMLRFYDWTQGRWSLLFSHAGDDAPFCASELAEVAGLKAQWDARGVKPVGLSLEDAERQHRRECEIAARGRSVNFPMIADTDHAVAALYGMSACPAARRLRAHHTFIIDSARQVRAVMLHSPAIARNFVEILRMTAALQEADGGPRCGRAV